MATHSIMKVGEVTTQKDNDGNPVEVITLTDYEPRVFTVKLTKATEEQKAALRVLKDKSALIPTSEGAMNGQFWMSIKPGSIIPLPAAK